MDYGKSTTIGGISNGYPLGVGGGGGSVVYGNGGSVAVQSERSMIRDAITGTEQATTELHAIISELEQRLDAVLTPSQPNVAVRTPEGQPISSPVCNRVQMVNAGFAHAVDRIRELIKRVEI